MPCNYHHASRELSVNIIELGDIMDIFGLGLFVSDEMLVTPMSQLSETMPTYIDYWMKWMGVIAVTALIWSIKKVEARYVVGAFIVSIALTRIYGAIFGTEHVLYVTLSIGHVLVWTPALYMIWRRRGQVVKKSIYGAWLGLAVATMLISLFFDWRDTLVYLTL